MKRNYPDNCWYVAASAEEVGDAPLGRRLLDQLIVLYRNASGNVVAFEDRCPHRAARLSRGTVQGDTLVCAYHGFAYDSTGRCIGIPSQANVPTGLAVRSFPVREQAGFVWLWPGDPTAASLREPPRLPWLSDESWTTFGAALHVDANYMLLHEHHLDLTAVRQLHPATLPPELELSPLNIVEVTELSVSYRRDLAPAPLAEWEAEATGLARDGSYSRSESGAFLSPALNVQRWDIDGGDSRLYRNVRVLALTPEHAGATHVFLRGSHDYALDRTVVTEHLEKLLVHDHAQRDKALLEEIEATYGYETWALGVHVKADTAALKARRIVSNLLAEEQRRA